MSYQLDHHLSLAEMADAIVNLYRRERYAPKAVVQELLERELKSFLICIDSELSVIAHGRPPEREECDKLSSICREILGMR